MHYADKRHGTLKHYAALRGLVYHLSLHTAHPLQIAFHKEQLVWAVTRLLPHEFLSEQLE